MALIFFLGGKNLVYTSIAGIIRVFGFYNINVKVSATTIINLLIFSAVTESDLSYENFVREIAPSKQIERREFYNMNEIA